MASSQAWLRSQDWFRGRGAGSIFRCFSTTGPSQGLTSGVLTQSSTPELDRMAEELVAAAREKKADEIVLVGHSLGAVLAVDLLDRALLMWPELGRNGTRLVLLSVGSSILKIGLHRGARRFRASLQRVATARGVFWGEYQSLTDVMNFYRTDPVRSLGLTAGRPPFVRLVRFRSMLSPAGYRRLRRNFFRVHCQFIRANDCRASYDYFMFVCGPLAAQTLVEISPRGDTRHRVRRKAHF